MPSRRSFLTTGLALLAAPALVRATSIMRVKSPTFDEQLEAIGFERYPQTVPVMSSPEFGVGQYGSGFWGGTVCEYTVAPGKKIWRGDLVVVGRDGYARTAPPGPVPVATFEAQCAQIVGTAAMDSYWRMY